jgi:hypothetical protein
MIPKELEIDAMVADKYFDALLYAKIFKWDISKLDIYTLPNYSTDIGKAVGVLEYLQNKPCNKKSDTLKIEFLGGQWVVNFRGVSTSDSRFAFAVCKACLKYVLAHQSEYL